MSLDEPRRPEDSAVQTPAQAPRILVIDDDPQMHRFLKPALTAGGYEIMRADTGAEGLIAIAAAVPEAVVLELDLPDTDGKEVLSAARAFYTGPIIILSDRGREADKIAALDLGADDYVQKPCGVGELMARLRVALRHHNDSATPSAIVIAGDLEIDPVRRLVTRAGEILRLAPKESDLLFCLVNSAGKIVPHQQLITAVWGPGQRDAIPNLRVLVSDLRQKIEVDATQPKHVMTELGVGYRFIR
ncbi:MAG: response regulator [Caulobacterales bacterium]